MSFDNGRRYGGISTCVQAASSPARAITGTYAANRWTIFPKANPTYATRLMRYSV